MPKNWTELLAERARGREVGPEELKEVRRAAKAPGSAWAEQVAARAQQKRWRPDTDGMSFAEVIAARLHARAERDDGSPDAA